MRDAHAVADIRAAEDALLRELPDGALMNRAAGGLATACAQMLGRRVAGRRVVLLVGGGDNGGDALYAGARLAARGAGVTAVLLSDRAHAGGLAALRARGGRAVPSDEGAGPVSRAHLVVDGIAGIGGRGGLRPPAAELVRCAERAGAAIVAVDVPTGVVADTGEVADDAVTADVTVTFGTHKPGLLIDPGCSRAGVVQLVDIGLGPQLAADGARPVARALQHADVAAVLPKPAVESNKYRRGVVGIAAGSERYPGAGVLAVAGALRGGAGAVRYIGPPADDVIARFPEVLVGPGRVQAWVAGPGFGDAPEAQDRLNRALAAEVPTVVDADGLRQLQPAVSDRTAAGAPLVLTPHAGEAAALLGTERTAVESGRLAAVRRLADEQQATVALKGSTTLIAAPGDGPVLVNPTGTGWLASAGTGDVLAGLVGSLLAAGCTPLEAASAGAYLHGLAARRTAVPLTAMDVADALPAAWQQLL